MFIPALRDAFFQDDHNFVYMAGTWGNFCPALKTPVFWGKDVMNASN